MFLSSLRVLKSEEPKGLIVSKENIATSTIKLLYALKKYYCAFALHLLKSKQIITALK
jgi:hypothetical protein